MALRAVGLLAVASIALIGLHRAFVANSIQASRQTTPSTNSPLERLAGSGSAATEEVPAVTTAFDGLLRFAAGAMLGLALVAGTAGPARADVEDVVIPVDDKGKTTTLTKEQLVRGKRLFNAACASCHVGGGTRTNQNVGLAIEELSGAQPNRASVEGLVDYLNNPTTYDGLKDISEVHPSIKGGDIWPKMRSMKQQDTCFCTMYDMSAYILYQNQTIPEKWGSRGWQWFRANLEVPVLVARPLAVTSRQRGEALHKPPLPYRQLHDAFGSVAGGFALSGLVAGFGLLGLRGAFVAQSATQAKSDGRLMGHGDSSSWVGAAAEEVTTSPVSLDGLLRFAAGAMLGLALVAGTAGPARADVEDVVIPVDDKGKTTTLTKEQLVRGKRLFNAACASCHVGGGTRTNQNVGLAIEELSGAQPNRASVEGLVDYLNNPTTYDGLKDISEVHPSIKGGDIWPKMRSMKQQDTGFCTMYDMSAYILYQNQTIPEKWGGGKTYY
ncbi:psbV [Symbiodinium natans]|uniref:PsbV protein n=1 Tax=Symbiodinium natans TaxID=878477 RepID=A0A812R344_9DINO|nr:psbV [Symbiodinium natans]